MSRTGGLRGKSAAGGIITLMTAAVHALTQKNYDAEPWDGSGEQPLFMLIKPVLSGVQDVYTGKREQTRPAAEPANNEEGDLLCHH